MTQKQCWYADQGPFLYEDTNLYPDSIPKEGGRTPQVMVENAPSQYYHIARKSELDSVAASLVTGTTDSMARSMATSAGSQGDAADSKAVSAQVYASSADTSTLVIVSVADSKTVSVGANDSASRSIADSQDVSQGVRLSVIESKLTSGGW